MRNFFAQQERARRNTVWLVLLFLLAVVAIAAAVYLVMFFGMRYFDLHGSTASARAGWWDLDLFLSFFVGTLVIILFASFLRGLSLRAGGSAVAEMLGGRLIPPGTGDFHERRLLNVVEEMALAAGVPVPQVYLLEEESGINAFAAGHTPDDAAVVATRGCVELLSREELQGVIAHEFSHILNGDMRLKLRLIGILFGILVISVIGRGMLHITRFSAGSSRRGRGGSAVVLALIAGLVLMLIGYIGLFCGRLIKAAVSRQREFLADASAVQFTRNPQGIAGALKKIGGYAHGSRIESSAAEETSHLFFSPALDYPVFGFWFATHPPLEERIRRIDPSFDGSFPQVAAPREGDRALAAAAGAAEARPAGR
ncbi:MAG: M48 family metalloprotease, partial [Candidatus Eisenbacteria bacterium]|nr:M48 family metalloprotease [Candidatus Eisenbacteria bacterium]